MSSDYSVTITGTEDLIKRLEALGDSKTIRGSLESIGLEMVTKDMMKYPPVVEGSKYQRTLKLRNSWDYRVSDDGYLVEIGSSEEAVPYNRYVMDRDYQTHTHQWHGWKTVQGILQSRLEWIKKTIRDDIQKALDGRGR